MLPLQLLLFLPASEMHIHVEPAYCFRVHSATQLLLVIATALCYLRLLTPNEFISSSTLYFCLLVFVFCVFAYCCPIESFSGKRKLWLFSETSLSRNRRVCKQSKPSMILRFTRPGLCRCRQLFNLIICSFLSVQ